MGACIGEIVRHANELAYAVEPVAQRKQREIVPGVTVEYVGDDVSGHGQLGVVAMVGKTLVHVKWDAGHEGITRPGDLSVVSRYTPVAWSWKYMIWVKGEEA